MYDICCCVIDIQQTSQISVTCGLYYKCVTIVIDAPSVVKVTLQIVASLTIVSTMLAKAKLASSILHL